MAAYDNKTSNIFFSGVAQSSFTNTHTVNTANNTTVIAIIQINSMTITTTGATYAGQAMTLLRQYQNGSYTYAIYARYGVAAGSGLVSAPVTTAGYGAVMTYSFTGTNPITQAVSIATGTSIAPSRSYTPVSADAILFNVLAPSVPHQSGTSSTDSNVYNLDTQSGANSKVLAMGTKAAPGTASQTTTWSLNASQAYEILTIEVPNASLPTPIIDAFSANQPGFVDITDGTDLDPFDSGDTIQFNINSYIAAAGTNTYWFDASAGTTTDPNNVWTDDAYVTDNTQSTYAYTTTTGSTSTNFLYGKGTNAPSMGGTITNVTVRAWGWAPDGPSAHAFVVYTSGLVEALGTNSNAFPGGSPGYNTAVTLSTPTGGWTWKKLRNLEFKAYGGSNFALTNFSRIEITVTSGAPTPLATGTTYYWKVRAKDPTGSNAWSDWSGTRNFTIASTMLLGYKHVFLTGAWVAKPVKYYNGSAWVQKKVKTFNGSTWNDAVDN